ncbi:PQQ-dependent sugar dehydrogenase [Microbacterium sp. P02]|uniref:PQQ-dependent sugar dehydrogenase n=1 Tax=Microbacterium sp. P02 TaxID=3366260 RepID=UPI00367169AD
MKSRRGPVAFTSALGVIAVLAGCAPTAGVTPDASPATSSAASDVPAQDLRDVTTGLALPWSIAFVGETALVSERDTGRILELDAAGSAREVGVVRGVTPAGEGGLLGLAVDDQDRLYAYSTGADGNRIQRIDLTGAAGSYGLGEAATLIDGLPKASFHNGGRLAFGPDGMLYAGVGDAGDRSSSQDLDALSGKILRLTPDGGIPADNPFPGSAVWSYGHRNVQGLAWAADGTMFASEFGQDTWDELNVIEPGANYGWPTVEGKAQRDGFTDPVQQWSPGEASPSGIAVVDETVYIANLRGERLRAVPVADTSTYTDYLTGDFGRLRTVIASPDGGLWVLTNNTNGRADPRPGDDRIVRIEVPQEQSGP